MSFEFQSTLVNLTPSFRVAGEQIGGVRLITLPNGQKVARVIITDDKDIQFSSSGKPYEVGDADGIYATLSADLAEVIEDKLLINPSAISSVKYTAEEIVINIEGDARAWRFLPSSDPELLGPKEIADHTYEITVAGFAALTTAAATFRESVDGTLEGLNTAIVTEVTDRTDADAVLQSNIDAEAADRAAADSTLQGNIDAEGVARTSADITLQGNIDAEAVTRAADDTALSGRLDVLESDPTTAAAVAAGDAATLSSANTYTDTSITNLVNGADAALDTLKEIGDALAQGDSDVTAALTAQITTESTTRAAADTALDGRVAALEADPVTKTYVDAADTTLQSNIDSEAGTRASADSALDARLDVLEADPTTATAVAAVQSDVDANEADGDAADAALSARLDVLEADPTTATAVAAVQADVDQNESDADAAIALKLDASAVSAYGLTLVDDADAATARTTLGLGTAATTAASDYATAAQGALADTAVQPAAISNIDNTSDADKPVSTAQQAALDLRALLDGTNIPGPYADDTAAASGGVAVGALYKHNNGQIHYRVS